MTFGILETLICVLFASLMVTVLLNYFKIPVVLGYFVVGAILGPHALNVIPDIALVNKIAEFGIVFLMFTVGLEFSQSKLFSLKKAVLMIGGLQVLLSISISIGIGLLIGMSIVSALVVGGVVAMSSTAIVIKQLDDQLELYTVHGMNAVGALIFQDLAVIPFFILIVGLSTHTQYSLVMTFLEAILNGILAIILISFLGRWFLQPAFQLIARTRAIELFTLTVLLITILTAWLTSWLGLSYSLGAFLAGMMLSETTFRHQVEIEIRPFKDVLLGLFFITIGMLVDIRLWYDTWIWIALLLTAIVFGKMILIFLISRFTGNNYSASLRTGLILAQGGEFGFAILTLALTYKMIPAEYGQVILAALLMSIAISPILIYYNELIAKWLLPKSMDVNDELIQQKISHHTKQLHNHVIICGFGRVGQQIATLLKTISCPYIGLDIDPEIIQSMELLGENTIFGDASHPSILKAAGIKRAAAIVISFDKLKPAQKVLSIIKAECPRLPVVVRCKDQDELETLKKYHRAKIIAETYEESLSLTESLLNLISVPKRRISHIINVARHNDYDILKKIFLSSSEQEMSESIFTNENIMPILLPDTAYAIGHSLNEFHFGDYNAELIGVRRDNSELLYPNAQFKFKANDIVVIYGALDALKKIEYLLLEGLTSFK